MRKEISQGEILHNRNEMQFKMNTSDALFRLSERVRKLEENLKPYSLSFVDPSGASDNKNLIQDCEMCIRHLSCDTQKEHNFKGCKNGIA